MTEQRIMVKLCGLRSAADLDAAHAAGADSAGVVLTAGLKRSVSTHDALAMTKAADRLGPCAPRVVGVFVDDPIDVIADLVALLGLRAVQLSGTLSTERIAQAIALDVSVTVAVHVGGLADLDAALAAIEACHAAGAQVLLDASHPHHAGGTGTRIDLRTAALIATRHPHVHLAGGLTPATVRSAIAAVRPAGVDVSSGIEIAGCNDPATMTAFVSAARAAHRTVRTPLAGPHVTGAAR